MSWSVSASRSSSAISPAFLTGRGVDHVLTLPQLVLLRREGERVDDRLLDGLVLAGRLEPADRLGVLDELLGRHLAPVEERPPDRLALAVVVVEQLPRERAGLVAGREQRLAQRHALGLLRLDRLRLDRLGRRERPEGVERLLPPLEQPVAQEPRGDAVLAVVGGDLVEDPLVAREHPLLEGDDRGAALPDLRLALERQERLQLLQPVARPRDVQAAADDLVEVDEDAAPEQVVELGLARAVLAHQAAQRRDLVGRVVVDVQRRVGGEPLVDEVDEALERVALLVAGGGEDRLEAAVRVEDPPEVLEAALVVPERVALEVEEEVARRGVGEEREARLGAGLEDDVLVFAGLAGAELEPGLAAQRLEAVGGDAVRDGLGRRLAERREGRDRRRRQARDLAALDPGDAGEVVDLVPARVAERLELADAAVVDRVGLGRRAGRRRSPRAAGRRGGSRRRTPAACRSPGSGCRAGRGSGPGRGPGCAAIRSE